MTGSAGTAAASPQTTASTAPRTTTTTAATAVQTSGTTARTKTAEGIERYEVESAQ